VSPHPQVVRRLAGAVVGVPRPEETAAFLADGLGFALHETGEGPQALCAGEYGDAGPQRALTLVERPANELVELRLEATATADLQALEPVLREHGAQDVALGADGRLRFRDPVGLPAALGAPEPPPEVSLPANGLRPRRLGHVNAKAPDLPALTRFWVGALGMWLSERIGDDLVFLRFGGEHHNLGLRSAPAAALHHVAFELPGWDAYRPVLDHLADAGHQVEFGPGRHAVGRNLFTYLRDPDSGLRIELFADMARVLHQDDPAVAPIAWRAEDRLSRTLNRWSSTPPPASFLE